MEGLTRRPAFDELEQRYLLAQLQAQMFGQATAVEFGRYVLSERLGSGAMGVVYVAEDPRLRRDVALKVLHPDRHLSNADGGHKRLRAEARAISRVSHPNVIEVYDVGESNGRVYIAMELVRGQSLDQWTSTQRSWLETLGVFLQAGEGLAAAHAAGVVHRDFKPTNVQVGDDGRVRVLDFGLARSVTLWSTTSVDPRFASEPATSVTADGALVGTPRYMAPAQLRGAAGDPPGDQYAFCVALYEALFDGPPFDVESMLASKERGDAMQPKDPGAVPLAVRAALRRGLSASADQRFGSMADLLATLRPSGPARWRGAALASAAILGVGAAAWSLGGADPSSTRPVDAPDAAGALSDADREALRKAETSLEEASVLDEANDFAGALAAAQEAQRAAAAAGDRWMQARAGLAAANALRLLDRDDEAMAILEQAHLDAVVSEQDRLRVKIAMKLARIAAEHTHYSAATRWLRDVEAGLERTADDPELTRRYYALKGIMAREEGRRVEAVEWARKSVAASRISPGHNDVGLISALQALGIILFEHQELDEAAEVLQELVERGEAWGGTHDRIVANGLAVLAGVEITRANVDDGPPEQFEKAVATARRAFAAAQKVAGPDHYSTANARLTLGIVLSDAKLFEESRVELELAEAQFEKLRGPSDPGVAAAVGALGMLCRFQDQYEEAEQHFQRAVVLMETAQGVDFPDLVTHLTQLGQTQIDLGRLDAATTNLERARTLGIELSAGRRASTMVLLGALEEAKENFDEAARNYEEGADLWAEVLGEPNWRTDTNREHAASAREAASKKKNKRR